SALTAASTLVFRGVVHTRVSGLEASTTRKWPYGEMAGSPGFWGGIPPAIRQRPPPVVLPDYATGDIASAVALACRSPSCIASANVRYASNQAAFTSGVNAEPRPCSSVQSRAAPTGP